MWAHFDLALDYTYESGGLRTRRTNGATTYEYIYTDGKLTQMWKNGAVYNFAYDVLGNPMMILHNGNRYYYLVNTRGDVEGILNSSGTLVVEYRYDAWGRLLSTRGSMANTLGQANPLRYRGYVYDQETGLYYLQSRYYNPEIGRFINADAVVSGSGDDILGANQFVYCFNNPINLSDNAGTWPEWIETAAKVVSATILVAAVVTSVVAVSAFTAGTGTAGAVFGASVFLGAALSGVNGAVANEANGNSYLNGYVGGAIGGAIQGVASKTPIGTILGGSGGVAVGTAVTNLLNNIDPMSADLSAGEIAAASFLSGGKALVTSSLTAFMGYASDMAVIDGAGGLMPTYTFGFGVVCFKRLIHHDMSKSLKTYKATKQKGATHEQTENNRTIRAFEP